MATWIDAEAWSTCADADRGNGLRITSAVHDEEVGTLVEVTDLDSGERFYGMDVSAGR